MSIKPLYLRSMLPCLILAAGCAASSGSAFETQLDTDFRLQIGQAASVTDTEFELGFLAVTEDSRCPKGENCFSAGDAVVRIWTQVGSAEKLERDLHIARQGPKFADHANYRVQLVSLDPTPVSGVATAPEKYVATFRVTQK